MNQFGIEDDIFEVGITSISSMRLLLQLSKKYNVVLKSQDLNTCSTIKALESRILSLQNQNVSTIELQHDYPITQTQVGIFVECSAHPDETAYNLPFLFKLPDSIDLERLRQAWIDTINAHYYVKTHLIMNQDGDIRAVRCDDSPADVQMVSRDDVADERAFQRELLKPFKLLDTTLYRVQIIHTPSQNYLFIDFHHIICDGSSLVVLFEDLNRRYAGESIEKEDFSGFELAADEEVQIFIRKLKTISIKFIKGLIAIIFLKEIISKTKHQDLAQLAILLNCRSMMWKPGVHNIMSHATLSLMQFLDWYSPNSIIKKNRSIPQFITGGRMYVRSAPSQCWSKHSR